MEGTPFVTCNRRTECHTEATVTSSLYIAPMVERFGIERFKYNAKRVQLALFCSNALNLKSMSLLSSFPLHYHLTLPKAALGIVHVFQSCQVRMLREVGRERGT